MSGLKPEARRLLETAARYEELPSRERVGRMRSAVLRRAALGSAVAVAGSTGVWAKALALGASTAGQVATYAVLGALAGGVVVAVAAPPVRGLSTVATVPRVVAPASRPLARAAPAPGSAAPSAVDTGPAAVVARDSAGSPAMSSALRSSSEPLGHRVVEPSGTAHVATAPGDNAPALAAPHEEAATAPVDKGGHALEPAAGPAFADPQPTRDELLPQLDVLHRMRLDLTAQQSGHALSLYRANEQLFRGSALEPEARAALIAAMCQQGRIDEARRESAALRASFPNSHLARRLALGCASTDAAEEGR